MYTRSILLACLAAVVLGAPQDFERQVEVIRDERVGPVGASYTFDFAADNGIAHSETGSSGAEGQSNSQGSYSFTDELGNTFEVRYVANEFGFQPEGAHLPVAPPAPPHVAELLRIAEEQRAAGITFEKK